MLARVIVQKFRFGMPYFRQEELLEADGIALDRGTMSRSSEEVGACFGAIVLACADDARKHAFCLSTDATGLAIQSRRGTPGIAATAQREPQDTLGVRPPDFDCVDLGPALPWLSSRGVKLGLRK